MRTPYSYGLPGDVSFTPQNRVKELYYGSAPNGRMPERTGSMRSLPSGSSYAGALGKNVNLNGRGMGALVAVPYSQITGRPVMRAAYESARLGVATPLQMAALGDGTADRAACMATTGAMVGGAGVAQQMNTQSAHGGTADQGWTTGISIFSALANVGQQMCGLIQTSGQVTSAPAGTTPPPLPAATSSIPSGPSATSPTASSSGDWLSGVPNWGVLAGAAVIGGLISAVAFSK